MAGIANCKKCDRVIVYGVPVCNHCGTENPMPVKCRLSDLGIVLFILLILPFMMIGVLIDGACNLYDRYIRAVQRIQKTNEKKH